MSARPGGQAGKTVLYWKTIATEERRPPMRIDVLGVGFDNMTVEQAVAEGVRLMSTEGAHYAATPNPEIVETCRRDEAAMEAVNGADLVLADGIGVIYGAKIR